MRKKMQIENMQKLIQAQQIEIQNLRKEAAAVAANQVQANHF